MPSYVRYFLNPSFSYSPALFFEAVGAAPRREEAQREVLSSRGLVFLAVETVSFLTEFYSQLQGLDIMIQTSPLL